MKYYPKPEISIVLLVIISIILLITPFSISSSQAYNISKWNEKYNRVEYMFSVMKAQITDDMLKSMNKASTPQERERVLLLLVKPYLRINVEKIKSKHYKPRFINGTTINKKDLYYFNDFYSAENNSIVGIKEYNTEKENDPLFMMMFDINGFLPPNKWGRDIFGIYIYDHGKINAFGSEKTLPELKEDCSKKGSGVSCSYYYKIGGGFDD